eukprot:5973251-Amphidinium_carterae.1
MQQGPVMPQACGAQVHGYPQAFVMMPMAAPQWCGGAAPAPMFATCSPAAPPQQQKPPCKPSNSALLGGVFGIAGVSQLPAASTASKDKQRKNKGRSVKFPQERQAQKSSVVRRAFDEGKPRLQDQSRAAAHPGSIDKAEAGTGSPLDLQAATTSATCATNQAH